jgi:ABC-type lipoprotein export system ATPase subunit
VTQVHCPSFIGRASEKSAIRALLDGVASRSGGTVAVVGEQGVGKSRLLREAAEAARSLDITVLAGRGVASDRTTAFRPITEGLLGHFRHQPVGRAGHP